MRGKDSKYFVSQLTFSFVDVNVDVDVDELIFEGELFNSYSQWYSSRNVQQSQYNLCYIEDLKQIWKYSNNDYKSLFELANFDNIGPLIKTHESERTKKSINHNMQIRL